LNCDKDIFHIQFTAYTSELTDGYHKFIGWGWWSACIRRNIAVVVHAEKIPIQCADIHQQSDMMILLMEDEHKLPCVVLIGSKFNS
jgi:hypothetical protein